MALTVFIQDEFIGTREEPDTKGAHMDINTSASGGAPTPDNALVIDNVTKTFGKENGHKRQWPWQKRNQKGEKKDGTQDGKKDAHKGPKKVVAVDHITLTVKHHEIYGILGANGSGKSTLIRLASTLLIPDSGKATVFGHDVYREEMTVKRLINRVSVDAAFFKKLSPMENLMYAARLYDMNAADAKAKSLAILDKLGIEKDSIFRPLEDMSRGMQQKVAIARAFLTSPILLLLDEPTTGLDPRSKHDVQDFVLDLRNNHDTTIVLTTHDMEEADRLCDRIAILHKGKIVAENTPHGLKASLSPNGHPTTMEDVFMHYTGKTAEDLRNEEG
jgi:ABC-2 type transport system ATP-binding protein